MTHEKNPPGAVFQTPDKLAPGETKTAEGDPAVIEKGPSSEIPSRDGGSPIDAPPASPFTSLPREIAFIITIAFAQLLTHAGLGQGIAPLTKIGETFGTIDPAQTSWFSAAYALTTGTFILVAGRIGDIFGHKRMLVIGFLWYALWSLIAGFSAYAHSVIFFDICRALQGIGPAMLLPSALAILGHTYPPGPRKDMAFAIFGATAPNGFIVGGLFSSIFAELAWWPWAYWVMGMVCAALAAIAVFIIPADDDSTVDTSGTWLQRFDLLGSVVGVTGLILFNVAWNLGPVSGWGKPYVIVILILGFAFILAFGWVEYKAEKPLIPLRSLSSEAAFVLGCVALGWSSFGIWLYYFWDFVQVLRHATPLSAVAQTSAATVSGLFAGLSTGLLLSRVKMAYLICFSLVAFCVGNIIFATMPVNQLYWKQAFFALIITPWGMDMSFPAATIILSNLVPKEQQGIAASLVATVVNYSISLGLGIAGTVQVQVGHDSLLDGYRGAWYSAIGLSGCGVLLALWFIFSTRTR